MLGISRKKNFIFILILIISIYKCTPDSEKKLNTGLELYKTGKILEAIPYFEDWLINSSFDKIIKENTAVKNGSVVLIATVLDNSKTSKALKNKMKLKKTPVIEPKIA